MSAYHKNRFVHSQQIGVSNYLLTNFETTKQLIISEDCYKLYILPNEELDKIAISNEMLFNQLINGGFILDNSQNEYERVLRKRLEEKCESKLYHVIVNPTLDCNLDCWYCYENKISGSQMNEDVMLAIIKNVKYHYSKVAYQSLKLSFFGGEPFLKANVIKHLISEINNFCIANNIELLLDFTTNGTLITTSMLDFLSPFHCVFQITLDGNEDQHNKIKFFANHNGSPYLVTLNNIYRIQNRIPNAYTFVRINFDATTLIDFDSILNHLLQLDRKRTTVIMKKIWQVDEKDVNKQLINHALYLLLKNNFLIDYYGQGGWCFADFDNQVTINYDGGIFKCTTITHFDESESLGSLNKDTGEIIWDKAKTAYLHNEQIAENCKSCKMFPSCGGPCRRQMSRGLEHKCFLNDQGITMDDYALIQMHINYVKRKIYG